MAEKMRDHTREVLRVSAAFSLALCFAVGQVADASTEQVVPVFSQSCLNESPFLKTINSVDLYDGGTQWSTANYTPKLLAKNSDQNTINALKALKGRSFWEGYDSQYGGWDVPAMLLSFNLTTDEFILYGYGLAPNYLLAWENIPPKPSGQNEVYTMLFVGKYFDKPNADAQGKHWGVHPCSAIALAQSDFESLKNAMLLPGNQIRWKSMFHASHITIR